MAANAAMSEGDAMPRGHRKRGQFHFELWLPDGAHWSAKSTKDHSAAEFRAAALEMLEYSKRMVATTESEVKTMAENDDVKTEPTTDTPASDNAGASSEQPTGDAPAADDAQTE